MEVVFFLTKTMIVGEHDQWFYPTLGTALEAFKSAKQSANVGRLTLVAIHLNDDMRRIDDLNNDGIAKQQIIITTWTRGD